ncbi:MAG: acyl-CoA synthetase [Rhodospirillaceae bacterium]|nr:acyl-CoA synthetase [Rhodospirillaceae bacterium]
MNETPRIANIADVAAIEQSPLKERLKHDSLYAAIAAGMSIDQDHPAFHFLVDGNPDETPLTLTHGELAAKGIQVANLLHTLGAQKGDPVTVLMPNVPQKFMCLIGSLPATVFSPVNWMLEPVLIAEIIRAAGSKILIALGPTKGYEIWDKVLAILSDLPELEHVLYVTPPGQKDLPIPTEDSRVQSFDHLLVNAEKDKFSFTPSVGPDDIVAYIHTGGTTGSPKLAKITHLGLLHEVTDLVLMTGFQADDIVFGGGVLFHIGALAADTLNPLSLGATILVPSPLGFRNPNVIKNYWCIVEKFGATRMSGVVTTYGALLDQPIEGIDVSRLRTSSTGGMGMPEEIGHAMQRKIGVKVLSTYGMTEIIGASTMAPRDGDPRFGSSGIPMPDFRIRIVNLDSEGCFIGDCRTNEIGHIIMTSPGVIPGYVDSSYDEALFVKNYEPRWVNSGDLGRLDKDGYLWVTGRAKDIIIRSGHNIDPGTIEDALYKHPEVVSVAAVGKPDSYAGELPVAYVQLSPEAKVTDADLATFCRKNILERAANPVNIYIIDSIPLTGVGKISKLTLRHDATKRVFTELLEPLIVEKGVEIGISVTDDKRFGTTVTLEVADDEMAQKNVVESGVAKLFSPFTIHYEIIWQPER